MRETEFIEALRGRAHQRGQAPALRRKRRGEWTTVTWRDVSREVARQAGASPDALLEPETASLGGPWGGDELLLLLAGTHAPVPRSDSFRLPIGEALWLGHSGAAENTRDVVGAWLNAGFVLSLPEPGGDPWADARDIEPTVLLGDAATYRSLAEEVWARLPSSGTWGRRLVDRALVREGTLLPWLVIRSLRRVLGLRRTRVAYAIGGDPWPEWSAAATPAPVR